MITLLTLIINTERGGGRRDPSYLRFRSLDKDLIRWSLEVLTTMLRCLRSKSRPWNIKYESLKYENGRKRRNSKFGA